MTQDFMSTEVAKIFKNKKFEYPLNVAMAAVWILANFKGSNLKILDVGKQSSMADFFVLGSAGNPTQASAMADAIIQMMKKNDIAIKSVEGTTGADWTLIDLGDVIIHIFQETIRNVYDLEGLYASSSSIQIPEDYYFQGTQGQAKKSGTTSDDENYF